MDYPFFLFFCHRIYLKNMTKLKWTKWELDLNCLIYGAGLGINDHIDSKKPRTLNQCVLYLEKWNRLIQKQRKRRRNIEKWSLLHHMYLSATSFYKFSGIISHADFKFLSCTYIILMQAYHITTHRALWNILVFFKGYSLRS